MEHSPPEWQDEEDNSIKIGINQKNNLKKLKKDKEEDFISGAEFQDRLREQFVKMNSKSDIYKWAFQEDTTDEETQEASLGGLLKTSKNIVESNSEIKDTSILNLKQLSDLNKDNYHSSVITSVSFHPTKENLCFTGGLDKKLKLFSINDDDKATNIQNVNTVDMPIYSSEFLNDKEIILSGRRKHYLVYNIDSNKLERCNGLFSTNLSKEVSSLEKLFVGGNYYCFGTDAGNILMYDAVNRTYRYDIKISGSVNSVCFDKNGVNLYAVGDQSEIYVFDLRKYRSCVNKFNDSGNFNTTFMNLSSDNNYLATASNSGIVNLYSVETILSSQSDNIEPVKTIENLTTSCEYLKFSSTSKKLGFCSRWKKHGLKILNLNNLKVYSNFPTFTSSIKYPICFDFSANDKYICIGNDEGKALLYRLYN